MLRLTTIIIAGLAISCSSPQRALEKGNNKKAIRLAKKSIKKNRDIHENVEILNLAAHSEVENIMAASAHNLSSPEVEDWIYVQGDFYCLLENIGEANLLTAGLVSEPYERLCAAKTDLDFRIADHYYQAGEQHLRDYEYDLMKRTARLAYHQYSQAKAYGAGDYYSELEDKMAYCLENGRVYYTARNYRPASSLFLRALPAGADFEPDCILSSSRHGHSSHKCTTTKNKTFKKNVVVGSVSHTDTSGVVTHQDVYEDVYAYRKKTQTTITLRTTTWINVIDNTGQCSEHTRSFSTNVSGDYEEVEYSGDKRAYPPGARDKKENPYYLIRRLERELDRKVERRLGL